ncbi:MAG TPA: NfeD family protein [Candidatus Gemmiger avistercoris]|uniref:NfeD family protein n=1 Tax=Candidatus Gemmiger avistercoris TaxID=2838606 RepID=A0A9D2FKA5_9FIRM|nr:NfeD family protein [uncultured Subdoligranulum sp.]HIZ62220.1 NfeD family protein [Candidatus Gemmiger avistercoris]
MTAATVFWLIAVIAFVVLEAVTTALVSVWFAVGGVAALAVSFFTDSLPVQGAVFAVVSAIALGVMVPAMAKRRRQNQPPVTNGSPLTIGKQGYVLADIRPGYLGRVHVDGLDWQARADILMPKGAPCKVTDVDGAVLIVCPVTADTAAV